MEENKIDPYQILGFVLLMTAFVWYIYTIPEPEKRIIEKSKENLEISVQSDDSNLDLENDLSKGLSLKVNNSNPFVSSENKSKIKFDDVVVENDDLILKFSSKGGLLTEALLKNFTDYKGDPLYMIKDGNQNINLNFYSVNGQLINTSNYHFQPVVDKNYDGTKLSMILSISENQFFS